MRWATPIRRLSPAAAGGVLHGRAKLAGQYATAGVDGAPATASALLVLPHGERRLATVAYEHGTLVRRADAPSQGLDSLASSAAVLYGAAGFATVAPDYLGLGSGSGSQAYLHARTEAGASIDALRAARSFARRHGRRLDSRVLVTGFSQGGHAAMALARALQGGAAPPLRLRAVAPVSGVFDLQRAELPAILAGRLDGRISACRRTSRSCSRLRSSSACVIHGAACSPACGPATRRAGGRREPRSACTRHAAIRP